MRPAPVVLVTLAVAAAVTAVFVGLKHQPDSGIGTPPSHRVATQPSTGREVIDGSELAHSSVAESSPVRSSEGDDEDYGATIDKLLPLAEAGNAKAQYEIYKATAYCQDRVKFYFTRSGQRYAPAQSALAAKILEQQLVQSFDNADCSAQAEWVVAGCLSAECRSINSPTEIVRILTGDRWHEVQARARELGADLDAGRWDRLGLDSGGATSDQERTSGEP